MLLFIIFCNVCTKFFYRFQYISCYCLSSFDNIILPLLRHFNTSHVTVYHDHELYGGKRRLFQYISCYCLSLPSTLSDSSFVISIHLMLLFIRCGYGQDQTGQEFQYISCYCLSGFPTWHLLLSVISIHLMLLFITEPC